MEEKKPEVMINGSEIIKDDHHEGGYYDDLPGFRFHPTDEELVGFYLKRKVENKPLTIELIKQIDIYKYDPWDLPRVGNVGDNEWYFYCLRGRKYKNSIRPNRVTGHGFWKATGIDRPIYSQGGRSNENCIGLKKSLVYYRGSAGKGTKTDWMMHEFRLPADHANRGKNANTIPKQSQEAEVWTICRILKRAVSYRKYVPDLSDLSLFKTKRNPTHVDASSITSYNSDSVHGIRHGYADSKKFQVSNYMEYTQEKTADANHAQTKNPSSVQASLTSNNSHCSNFPNAFAGTIFHRNENWDELGAVVEFAGLDPSSLFGYCSS